MDMDRDSFQKTFHFSADASTPLYVQLAAYLKHQIQIGVLKPGDKMLAENDIAEILRISRTTVRLSFNHLVDEGLIVRYRGKGSYITEPKLRRNVNYLYNFTENIRASGSQPSSFVLRCAVEKADEMAQAKLLLPTENKDVFVLERLRLADGKPLILETSIIPYYLCRGIEGVDFSAASLYAVLQNQYDLHISRAEEIISAVVIKKPLCMRLECSPGSPGYRIERVSYLDTGYACEYTTSVTRGDRCVFKLDLYHDKETKNDSVNFKRHLTP